ncbi:2OG-Fe(II) oxygenase [Nitrospirillum pindoramense]|uniref:2-oxoglutarate-Fe(II)-dependent oxygenase superfamily protein n=1 Tax=Nitrospirillum amazonense TaxID=28077 RepID=A0A560GT52_9PROT|nr:2OG-Fe(II) oxygenase [Nitrospirillum amazonense]TWB37222.1 2-oxoglutarate-Fe(II)-dependent oxygenase superfamily protein [Nitrospirillum amazonense]
MRSLLAGLSPADIRTDPFPHIVADTPMEAGLYKALSASFPNFQRLGWPCPPERIPNNRRYELSAQMILDSDDMPDCWKEFVALHSGPAFLAEVEALFEGYWDPALLATLDGRLTGHRTGRRNLVQPGAHRIHQDARMEINTPVRDRPSSCRGPHLDTLNRLFSCLFYMRAPDDDAQGGDLELYRWRDGPTGRINAYDLPADAVEVVATVPYSANRLVIFPQSVNALHGVTARHPNPHTRRYVFITAELGEDWLHPPVRAAN